MKSPVMLAGGNALLLESKPRNLSQLTADGCILMYCDSKSQPVWYKDCCTYITRFVVTAKALFLVLYAILAQMLDSLLASKEL